MKRSPIEVRVAVELKRLGLSFRQQARIGPYYADFLLQGRHVIECDGRYWHKIKRGAIAYDRRRDAYMRRLGYKVVRLSGREINSNAARAVQRALKRLGRPALWALAMVAPVYCRCTLPREDNI